MGYCSEGTIIMTFGFVVCAFHVVKSSTSYLIF
jgi:hypothetical protein